MSSYAALDDIGELTLLNKEVNLKIKLLIGVGSVNITQVLGNVLVEDKTADGAVDYLGYLSVADILGDTNLDSSVKCHYALLISHESLVNVTEYLAFALFSLFLHGKVVGTQYHIL